MSTRYEVEVHRRVFDNEEGHFLTVGPSPDFPDGNVIVHAEQSEKDYFGEIRLDLPAAFMKELGTAMIHAADEILSKT